MEKAHDELKFKFSFNQIQTIELKVSGNNHQYKMTLLFIHNCCTTKVITFDECIKTKTTRINSVINIFIST